MGDLDTTLPGYAVYREGDLQLLCNARSEEEALDYLRTILDIPLSRDGLRFEELTAEEVAELTKEHRDEG
ncbi:hypothetical protein GGP85_002888 [Salinibacter ruber]|uniref:hypothetical protein n=1 Tax=Salinibacter ruber TaxID=146919 RepID=UPI00216894C8|nr:hypothetical protein [Salinibacter ruber]MCS3827418.1 hypothetical protein [Salinibacter ruber]